MIGCYMGITTNRQLSLEDRIRSITRTAQARNIDFDLCFISARSEWNSNWGEGYTRSTLEELLELIEEDMGNPVPAAPALPDDPDTNSWKL